MKNLLISVIAQLVLAVTLQNQAVSGNDSAGNESRHASTKAFSLFNVVNFQNTECQGSSGLSGECRTTDECSSRNGRVDGTCAQGFGSCCTSRLSVCGSRIVNNLTYVESPGYPRSVTTAGSCSFSVGAVATEICQLRLDFIDFLLDNAVAATGTCATDTLTIIPGAIGTNPPIVCGNLVGQHMYIQTGESVSAGALNFVVATATTQKWRVRVAQIECYNLSRAPPNCLQFYIGGTGTIQSFNFNLQVNLRNQDYSVCFRMDRGYCGISFSESGLAPSATVMDTFQLGSNVFTTAKQGTITCANSWLIIPSLDPTSASSYCGNFLSTDLDSTASGAVESRLSPLRLGVYAGPTQANLAGFSLNFNLIPC